ncbi:MAG: hypothetical protein E6G17_00020 [Actinobacteria bacterium]|nr:MAG: hypothetical protein E6G17_00020 [Actinomycetota bacterium]
MRTGRLAFFVAALMLVAAMVPSALGAGTAASASPAVLAGVPVAGVSSYVDGAFVSTDYAYDDHDVAYPDGLTNAADLVQLHIGLDGGAVHVRAILETLRDAHVPVLGVGFDTDNNPRTGMASFPGGRWTANPALGLDAVAVVHSAGGWLLRPAGARWTTVARFPTRVDAGANLIDATIPLRPGAARWRMYAVLGAADANGHDWVDGSQPISDLAFVGDEAPANWQHQHQDAVLAGAADSRAAGALVDFGLLASRATRPAPPLGPGFHTLLYRSRLRLGEGIGQATIDAPGRTPAPVGSLYAGPYQPYLVWLPGHLPPRPPLIVHMHGFGGDHTSDAGEFGPVRSDKTVAGLFIGDGGFTPPAVVAFPLGRGENTFYMGPAEQDVLDVTTDALARFGADPDRVVLSGVSMGGFGTFRIGIRFPDRWSALVPFIGTGGSAQYEFGAVPGPVLDEVLSPSRFPAGAAELLDNLADLPIRMVNGQVDPLVNNVLVSQDTLRLDQLGYDYRAWVLLRRQHEVVPALSNCVLLEALTHRRQVDPAHVVLAVEPAMFMHDPATGLDLHYDHAYWVSGVVVRDGADTGSVDVTSLARADRANDSSRIVAAGENVTSGADLCGPNDAVHTGDAWREVGIELRPARSRQPVGNGLGASLRAVSDVTLDLGRMGLRVDHPLAVAVTGDGVANVRLVGPWTGRRVVVERDGTRVAVLHPTRALLTLTGDLSGRHVYVLRSSPS